MEVSRQIKKMLKRGQNMYSRIVIAGIIVGLAAFSPAPINQAKGPRSFHAEQSQDQVAKQLSFTGKLPVVGQVPQKVNEVGMAIPPKQKAVSDHSGDQSMMIGTASADKVGGNSVTIASNRIETEKKASGFGWIFGLLISALGFGAWKAFQYKIDKTTPVPKLSKRILREFEQGKL
jgi:hypothetical protein